MFKKKEVKRRPRPAGSLAQYGIFEVPASIEDIGKDQGMDDDDDEDLEAELAALTTGSDAGRRQRKTAKRIPDSELNAMVNESLKDIDPDEELSGDENDPNLLEELHMITGEEMSPELSDPTDSEEPSEEKVSEPVSEEIVKLLEERLSMYKTAEEKATNENNTSKARRFGRGIKTLKDMLSRSNSGKQIITDDIPPVLPSSAISSATEKPPEPEESETAPAVPVDESPKSEDPVEPVASTSNVEVDQETLSLLKNRQQEYRVAAVAWKRAGNAEQAIQYVKLIKQFDLVIAELTTGNAVDLSDMPGTPTLPETTAPEPATSEKEESEAQQAPSVEESPPNSQEPLTGSALESSLKERLEVYRRTKVAAEGEGNTSKARRYGRICKQFEDAIKLYARGKPMSLEELPTPPGFPPLTVSQPSPPEAVANPPSDPVPEKQSPKEPKRPQVPPRANAEKKQKIITSRADKQMLMLQQRQQEFKMAALKAKKEGDLELARDYLRQAKGLDPLIEASQSGLPVDMNSIPLSPDAKMQLTASGLEAKDDDSFDLISKQDCLEEATGTDDQIYENLEAQLLKQIKWCLSTRDHCKGLGDVPGYNRWERLALGYTRDLDMLRVRKRSSSPPPQHHYVVKTYAIVQCCTDLSDGDLELSIIRGVNFSKEADTYVIFEFPYPADNHTTDSTSTVRDSTNPEYNAVFPLNGIIDRSSRQCQRTFKRHSLKCQIWSKGGFFKRDSLLGTVSVKLQPLETQCILHDSFPLMDGRKATGGKLEVKMRLRNPLLSKQIDQITDKWLIIDH
ncbi:coiled-coil and C2 domain-containing protein 1-like isoform X2 [Leptopilina heterotoma]|uniref:coiled-coil and C2 domain-containing protein 1-like isoform X2 n=1 Tax=Leptopilina heterotoma TaxID=63436 RepID=UPI001CA91D3F|nr:coiled-coil and C2 domain-containing protein 1-like isoform X2 [Leptopilina heterotoma]